MLPRTVSAVCIVERRESDETGRAGEKEPGNGNGQAGSLTTRQAGR